jgi:hypothetical protein
MTESALCTEPCGLFKEGLCPCKVAAALGLEHIGLLLRRADGLTRHAGRPPLRWEPAGGLHGPHRQRRVDPMVLSCPPVRRASGPVRDEPAGHVEVHAAPDEAPALPAGTPALAFFSHPPTRRSLGCTDRQESRLSRRGAGGAALFCALRPLGSSGASTPAVLPQLRWLPSRRRPCSRLGAASRQEKTTRYDRACTSPPKLLRTVASQGCYSLQPVAPRTRRPAKRLSLPTLGIAEARSSSAVGERAGVLRRETARCTLKARGRVCRRCPGDGLSSRAPKRPWCGPCDGRRHNDTNDCPVQDRFSQQIVFADSHSFRRLVPHLFVKPPRLVTDVTITIMQREDG